MNIWSLTEKFIENVALIFLVVVFWCHQKTERNKTSKQQIRKKTSILQNASDLSKMKDRCPKSVGDAKQTLEIRVELKSTWRNIQKTMIFWANFVYLPIF